MAIGFEAFDLSGRVSIELDDADKILLKVKRSAASTDTQLTKLEKRAIAVADAFQKLSGLQVKSPLAGLPTERAPRTSSGGDSALRRAQADIARMQSQRLRWESDYTTHVARQSEQQYRARVNSYQRGLREFERTVNQQKRAAAAASSSRDGGEFGDIFAGVTGGNLAAQAISRVASAAAEGGRAVIRFSADMEQTKIGFTSVIGNAAKAEKLLKDLEQFSKSTPFKFEGLTPIAQRLLGANIELEKVIPLMRDLGNVTAATGKTSVERLEGIGVAITQIISKGKVSAEEMEQLAERGVPAWNILAEAIGKSVGETRKLSEDGQISADILIQALQRVARERFGDAMAKQAETGAGAFTKIEDAILRSAATMFKPYYDEVSKLAAKTAKELDKQDGDFFKVGNTIAANITEGLARGVLEFDYKGLFDSIYAGMQKDIASRGTIRSLLFSGALGPGIEQGLNNSLGLKLPDQIKREAEELRKTFDEAGKLISDLPLKYRENFRPFSREGNIVRGLDTISNTIKEINLDLGKSSKIAPIDIGAVDAGKKKLKELKYDLSSVLNAMRVGTASQESGGNKRAVNSRTGAAGLFQVLPSNVEGWTRAVFGRSMSVEDFKKDADAQIAVFNKFMGDYLKTALKQSGGDWEQAIRRAAAAWYGGPGNMKNFDANFGGKGNEPTFRQYTTSVLGKTKKVLGGGSSEEFDFNNAEQARRIGEKLIEEEKRRNEQFVRNREQSDDRMLELTRANASQEQSIYENMFARRQITETEYADFSVQAQVNLLEKEREILEERGRMAELSAQDRLELEQKIAILTISIQQTVIEGQTKAVRAFEESVENFARELEEFETTGYEKMMEAAQELRDAAREEAEARFNLVNAQNEGIRGRGRNLERVTAEIRAAREQALANKNFEQSRLEIEKNARLASVNGVKDEAKLKADINEAYRLKQLGLEAEYQAKMLEIGNRYAGQRTGARRQDKLETDPFAAATGGFFGGLGIGNLLGDAEMEEATVKADYMKAVYTDLGATVGGVFASMAGEAENALANFILTGEGGAAAFASLAASAIASLAIQSGIKAIFEIAEAGKESALALASAAVGDVRGAALHTAAAAAHVSAATTYGLIAGGAAAVGIGIGLAGGLGGGSKGGSASSGKGNNNNQQPDYYTVQNPPPQQQNAPRYNADPTTLKLLERIEALNNNVGTLGEHVGGLGNIVKTSRPGDVLVNGISQKKGLLSDTVMQELKSDGTKTTNFGKVIMRQG